MDVAVLGLVPRLSSAGQCGLLAHEAFFEHVSKFQPWGTTASRTVMVGELGSH